MQEYNYTPNNSLTTLGIINKHVVNYCEDNNIYEDEQNGFRKKDHVKTIFLH